MPALMDVAMDDVRKITTSAAPTSATGSAIIAFAEWIYEQGRIEFSVVKTLARDIMTNVCASRNEFLADGPQLRHALSLDIILDVRFWLGAMYLPGHSAYPVDNINQSGNL